jgi:SAM-dependent methyltransferase
MEPGDWNDAARDYDGEVLSVFHHDRAGKIRALIEQFGDSSGTATDLGCGTGPFLPLLCDNFGSVQACDYSAEMLAEAEAINLERENLRFVGVDLRKSPPPSASDFVLCVNVLLTPSLADREAMWRHLVRSIKPGGLLALVVPSLESALLSRHRLVEWNLRSKVSPKRALTESFGDEDPDAASISRAGLLDAGGMTTKHYLKEELQITGDRFGLDVLECEKIEYPWRTEFTDPPRWMREPYPWDWLVSMRRR